MQLPVPIIWDERLDTADKEIVIEINSSLDRLDCARAVEIAVSGPFARSKIAWKISTYQHALLHRVVSLVNGTAVAWNNQCTLSAILSARALMETMAIFFDLDRQVKESFQQEDLAGLDAYVQRGTFASRDEEWIKLHPETSAVNVLTYIDRLDKSAPGARAHYDALSERCHPNSTGHFFMFATLDWSDGTVRYSDGKPQSSSHCGQMLLAALALLPLVESASKRLSQSILGVSELQHLRHPVGGAP